MDKSWIKQPLMMAYEGYESALDDFGKIINRFQPETKTLIRKLERILIKLYWQNLSLIFNETCLNGRLVSNYTHTHTHTHTHIHIYIYVCVCVSVSVYVSVSVCLTCPHKQFTLRKGWHLNYGGMGFLMA